MLQGGALITFALLAGLTLTAAGEPLGEWARAQLIDGDDLTCKEAVDGDYFFVARRDDRIKSGYRIDVTSPSGTPKTFIISWQVQDEKGTYIGLKTPPVVITDRYVRLGDRIYAEKVAYQEIYDAHTDSLHVSAELKKYADTSNAPPLGPGFPNDELKTILRCEISLK